MVPPVSPTTRPPAPERWRAALLSAALCVVLSGCGDEPLGPETPAPGEAARVVLTGVYVAGGHEMRQETRVDSATARYTVHECSSAPIGVPCTALVLVRGGTVHASILQQLFEAAGQPAFRALRDYYRFASEVRPPDSGNSRLEIVRGGKRRVIVWESNATIPLQLVEYNCLLLAARSDPFLCD